AFGIVCAAAAAATAAASTVSPSVAGAAIAGTVWGALGTAIGRRVAFRDDREARATRRRLALLDRRPRAAPGLVTTLVAGALAAVWFTVAIFLEVVGVPLSAAVGGVLLALAMAPNALVALVAVAVGARVDALATGTALADPVRESFSLWEWAGSGVAPVHVMVLVAAPLVASLAGGRVAAVVTPADPVLARGLRNGVLFGAALVLMGWAGALHATAGSSLDQATVEVSIPALRVFLPALVWGIAGAWAAPRLPWPKVPPT
ncbi:MAG: hypothetical protein M3271_01085, partial [Actinomycetota bacterium]|nr:hypothetical protein [Actinomycetota bacterium]